MHRGPLGFGLEGSGSQLLFVFPKVEDDLAANATLQQCICGILHLLPISSGARQGIPGVELESPFSSLEKCEQRFVLRIGCSTAAGARRLRFLKDKCTKALT